MAEGSCLNRKEKIKNLGTSGRKEEQGKQKYGQVQYTLLFLLSFTNCVRQLKQTQLVIIALLDVVLNKCRGNTNYIINGRV